MAYDQTSPVSLTSDEIAAYYTKEEALVLAEAIDITALSPSARASISADAQALVHQIRQNSKRPDIVDALLQEYGLSTDEGIALMRLSEALIRTPDFSSARELIRDKFSPADWASHSGKSPSTLVNQATSGLRFSSAWIKASGGVAAENLAAKLGDRVLTFAVEHAMGVMGKHFVLGRSIKEAAENALQLGGRRVKQSYDMLGEAAFTAKDAERYYSAYMRAALYLEKEGERYASVIDAPSLSVKLSALHPRYEFAQREKCISELTRKVTDLALIAKNSGFGLTIDAEEADRLETSLIIFRRLLRDPALGGWDGLGFVVQAYQRRAIPLVRWLIDETRFAKRKIAVRLVKGAYWDMEIKRAQELGLESYPVFTRKENTDVSYLACARLLLNAGECFFPQFATHNAHTAAVIKHMAGNNKPYEFQRLHGMGEALFQILSEQSGVGNRVYAPVGKHKDLLPYLVRRLLENGANSSFVNQLLNPEIGTDILAADPIEIAEKNSDASDPRIGAPRDLFFGRRLSAIGMDLTQENVAHEKQDIVQSRSPIKASSIIDGQNVGDATIDIVNPAQNNEIVGTVTTLGTDGVDIAINSAASSKWYANTSAKERADCLNAMADRLEAGMDEFIQLCVAEAGKTLPDAVAEVREAVDFCRYYALQAQEAQLTYRKPLGVVACISPWNFPLAIFLGQISAALVTGNTVVAKPAEQTPLIAYRAVQLLHAAGIPSDAVHLLLGDGAKLGSALTSHPNISGVCFTGSTATAKRIALSLADTGRATVPLIAETGGINAMIVDSTALLEQVVQDVVTSAFQSAGQRCSACRLVCVQDDIADPFIEMLAGAMQELAIGDPALLSTDVGPVIDPSARAMIDGYVSKMKEQFRVIAQTPRHDARNTGHFTAPIAFEVSKISELEREIFGPILHVVRFAADDLDRTVTEINKLGYGLTIGLHTRIDERVQHISKRVHVGNMYVNRNQIGAVVGVQPFGGEGLSGTGPKAGGPHYLGRLTKNSSAPPEIQTFVQTEKNEKLTIDSDDIFRMIEVTQGAADAWATETTQEDRNQQVRHALSLVSPNYNREQPEIFVDQSISLPGPTGETNTMTLYPRGVLVSFGAESKPVFLRQIELALSAGNGLIVAETLALQQFLQELEQVADALPANLLSFENYDTAISLITHPIDGVIVDGEWRTRIADLVCRRDGPILPILSAFNKPERFYHERTLTIDTTAAGGNASLLAIS